MVHGNLRTNNIFIGTLPDGSLVTTLRKRRDFPIEIPSGSDILYMPPELLLEGKYNTDGDIWQLGLVFYQVLMYDLPFNDENAENLLQ